MFLHELELKQFRCFQKKVITFTKQCTVVTGNNGAGKTSLAEAIHYLCYMKSFRCSSVSDLIGHNSDSFFLKGEFSSELAQGINHTIQVGYAARKKAIKLDNKSITTYKEIFNIFQVITLLEDDINLVKGYPSERRSFIDQAALFLEPQYLEQYRNFKRIVQSRNSLLYRGVNDQLEFEVWTEKLWKASCEIQKLRRNVLNRVQDIVNQLLKKYFDSVYTVSIVYEAKNIMLDDTFQTFTQKSSHLYQQERIMKRSLFGAHLDDFSVKLEDKSARFFASRGQQKLVSLLCKLSLIELTSEKSFLPIIIIDDFIADFDKTRLNQLIEFFKGCKNQIIITTPCYDAEFAKIFEKIDPDVLSMTS